MMADVNIEWSGQVKWAVGSDEEESKPVVAEIEGEGV